jgi:hypothetical protein
MTTNNKQLMSLFALSAAALFLGACDKNTDATQEPENTQTARPDPDVKCFGINGCAGESQCGVNKPELGIEHACAGENECKGKGWITARLSDCDARGGESLGEL